MSLLRLDVLTITSSLILRCCYVALGDSFASFGPAPGFQSFYISLNVEASNMNTSVNLISLFIV